MGVKQFAKNKKYHQKRYLKLPICKYERKNLIVFAFCFSVKRFLIKVLFFLFISELCQFNSHHVQCTIPGSSFMKDHKILINDAQACISKGYIAMQDIVSTEEQYWKKSLKRCWGWGEQCGGTRL